MTADLRGLFLRLQEQLTAHLATNREVIGHPGLKGAASEQRWTSMLAEYLPKRYCVTGAVVIDSLGGLSHQLDLVIYDRQYSPFLFLQDGVSYIPAESVYAVFEVKQELSGETVEYAANKAASVRNLRRTSAPIPTAARIEKPRVPIPILAGLVCLDSRLSPAFGDTLIAQLAALEKPGRLDLICALQHGSCEVQYGTGAPLIERSASDTALIFFFLRLLERLQSVGTVPAMDLRQYGRVLEEC